MDGVKDRLPDEDITALLQAREYKGAVQYFLFYDPQEGLVEVDVTAAVVQALAREVQESRQRRCDACQQWLAAGYKPGFGECLVTHTPSASWWFCADFAVLDSRAVADGH